jgi:hypothetical protein
LIYQAITFLIYLSIFRKKSVIGLIRLLLQPGSVLLLKSFSAQNETLGTGSYIINMGVVPQTRTNALKPYGLVYDLLNTYHVPVKWGISQTKIKDADFAYNRQIDSAMQ